MKYNRVFAFGCSMTRYSWPTWADIYGSDAKVFYNYAASGAGNQFISNQLVEASLRYDIGKGDKILLMWSTESRIDSYRKENWLTPGNIYYQEDYSEDIVNLFSPRGRLIRDLATIKMAEVFLQNLGCEYFVGVMQKFTEVDKDILELYNVENFSYPSMLESVGGNWPEIKCTNWGNTFDYHPDPMMHYNYLNFAGLNPTKSMKLFAEKWQNRVDKYETHQEVEWSDDLLGGEMIRL